MGQAFAVSRRKTVAWGLVLNYASVAVSFLSGFLVMPISLRFIPRDIYGAWLASGNVLVWLTVADPGFGAIVQQKVAEAFGAKRYSDLASLAWSGTVINAVLSLAVLAAGLFARGRLAAVLGLPPEMDVALLMSAFTWAVAGTAISMVAFTVASVNLGMQATVGIGVPYVVIAMGSVALTVALLYAGLGLLAAPMANLLRGAALLVWNLGYLLIRFRQEQIPLTPRLGSIARLLRLGLYTFVSNGISSLSGNIDSFLVGRMLGPGQVPVFRATRMTVESSRLLVERPFTALMPALSHLAGTGEVTKARPIILRLTAVAIWGVVGLGGGFWALNRELVSLWVGGELYGGSLVNVLLCAGLVVGALTGGLMSICFALGAIEAVSRIRVVQAFLQVAAMAGLGWWLGMAGVAAAPLLASLVVGGWAVMRLVGELLEFGRADYRGLVRELGTSAVAACLAMASTVLFRPTGWLRLAAGAMLFVTVYGLSLVLLAPAFRAEASGVLRLLQGRLLRGRRECGEHDGSE